MTFKALVGKRMRQQFLVGADDLLKPLTAAVQLVEAVDPRLHGALEAADGLPGMYMFQQALLLLRRELSAEDTLALWEKLFALQCLVKAETPGDKGPGYPDVRPNLAAALLLYMRGHIIGKAKVNADLVKMFNVLPLKLEVGTLLDILLSQFPLGAGEAKVGGPPLGPTSKHAGGGALCGEGAETDRLAGKKARLRRPGGPPAEGLRAGGRPGDPLHEVRQGGLLDRGRRRGGPARGPRPERCVRPPHREGLLRGTDQKNNSLDRLQGP